MKLEDFDLGLIKVTQRYGISPLDDSVTPDSSGTYSDAYWTRGGDWECHWTMLQ